MAITLAELVNRVSARTEEHDRRIDGARKRVGLFQSQVAKLGATFAGVFGAAVIARQVGRAVKGIIDINRAYERLLAQLETVQGSADGARAAFGRIEKLAASTPFQIEQITEAFILLRALGVQPTNEEMIGLGNIASSMGRTITDVSAAIRSAAAGATLPIKQLGLDASVSGNQITLSFQGSQRTVERSAASITKELVRISDANFAGAMAREMDTLNGIISNFQDNIGIAARGMGEFLLPVLKGFAERVRDAAGAVGELFQRLGTAFREGRIDIETSFELLGQIAGATFAEAFVATAQTTINALADALTIPRPFDPFFEGLRRQAQESRRAALDVLGNLSAPQRFGNVPFGVVGPFGPRPGQAPIQITAPRLGTTAAVGGRRGGAGIDPFAQLFLPGGAGVRDIQGAGRLPKALQDVVDAAEDTSKATFELGRQQKIAVKTNAETTDNLQRLGVAAFGAAQGLVNIIRSGGGAGGIFGGILGIAGGIVGAVNPLVSAGLSAAGGILSSLGRSDTSPVHVRVSSMSPQVVGEFQRPQNNTIIIQQGDVEVRRISQTLQRFGQRRGNDVLLIPGV